MPAHAVQTVAHLYFRRPASATVIALPRAPFGPLVNIEGVVAGDSGTIVVGKLS
jgi:hypothetical protein